MKGDAPSSISKFTELHPVEKVTQFHIETSLSRAMGNAEFKPPQGDVVHAFAELAFKKSRAMVIQISC